MVEPLEIVDGNLLQTAWPHDNAVYVFNVTGQKPKLIDSSECPI